MIATAELEIEMGDLTVNIAKDFSPYPGGRFREHGPNSGEAFREDILIPKLKEALANDLALHVVLDGAVGYPSSFLEEAFGGLVRHSKVEKSKLLKIVVLDAKPPFDTYANTASKYMKDARQS